MFKFFDFLSTLFTNIVYFVVAVIESVVNFFGHIVKGISFLVETIAMLPPFCMGALLAIMGISIVTMLISAFVDVG